MTLLPPSTGPGRRAILRPRDGDFRRTVLRPREGGRRRANLRPRDGGLRRALRPRHGGFRRAVLRPRDGGRHRAALRLAALAVVAWCAGACGGESGAGEGAAPEDSLRQPHLHQATAPDSFLVRLETTEGDVVVRVRRPWAPRGADRFYNLVQAGYYDGVPVHRVVEGFIVDFGIHPDPWVNAAWRQAPLLDDPVRTSNLRGRMTFSKGGPDSRTTQVFVNTDDNPSLDEQGFAPFGEVVEGMDVVDRFHAGYGDGPPRGDGVYQAMAIAKGEEYFAEFPELDRIEEATILPEPGPARP